MTSDERKMHDRIGKLKGKLFKLIGMLESVQRILEKEANS
jgi:hypothetical protein